MQMHFDFPAHRGSRMRIQPQGPQDEVLGGCGPKPLRFLEESFHRFALRMVLKFS
jgi:hypothetical protein